MNFGKFLFLGFGLICLLAACKQKSVKSGPKWTIEHTDTLFDYFDRASQIWTSTGDAAAADSLCQIGLKLAEETFEKKVMIQAYNALLANKNLTESSKSADQVVKNCERLIPYINNDTLLFNTYIHLADYYYQHGDLDESAKWCDDAQELLKQIPSKSFESVWRIQAGKIQQKKLKFLDAYKNYLEAISLAEQELDTFQLKEAYSILSEFYLEVKLYDKALDEKQNQLMLIKSSPNFDSTELKVAQCQLEMIYKQKDSKNLRTREIEEIITYAKNHNLPKLYDDIFSIYRSKLVDNLDIQRIYNLYHVQYPEALDDIRKSDTLVYLRCQALFYEYLGQNDSVEYLLNRMEENLGNENSETYITNFYVRNGQYFFRHKHYDKAETNFLKVLNRAIAKSQYDYVLTSTSYLDSISAKVGDFRNAYRFNNLNKLYQDSLNQNLQKADLTLIEIKNQDQRAKQREAYNQALINRNHNLQYMVITILIALVFIFLVMLGAYRVPAWSIRIAGFFAFIFLFEFFILIADVRIHNITHGEPWKIMLIKVVLVGFLLPFHHWIEHRVIKFLVHRRLVNSSHFSFRVLINNWIERWKNDDDDGDEPSNDPTPEIEINLENPKM